MGPAATNYMAALITRLTPARNDQEHIPVITYNNPRIPDRFEAILANGSSPLPELIKTARVLEQAGADLIVMPCNTAHIFIDEISRAIEIPVLNMVAETVSHISSSSYSAVAILASSASVSCGIFEGSLRNQQIEIFYPSDQDQWLITDAIMKIKSGQTQEAFATLNAIGSKLVQAGAQAVVAGCTEISLVFDERHREIDFVVIDPMQIIANIAINFALEPARSMLHTNGSLSEIDHRSRKLAVV